MDSAIKIYLFIFVILITDHSASSQNLNGGIADGYGFSSSSSYSYFNVSKFKGGFGDGYHADYSVNFSNLLTTKYTGSSGDGFSSSVGFNGFVLINAAFSVSNQQPKVGEEILLTDLSTGNPTPSSWEWNFGDLTTSTQHDPSHTFQKPGNYLITLKVGNGTGAFYTKSSSVIVTSNELGIDLEIVETNHTQTVAYVGYFYKYKDSGHNLYNIHSVVKYFPVECEGSKRVAHINSFEIKQNYIYPSELLSDFNDTLYLYNIAHKQIGHITFQYEHALEKEFPRNAIIFLHNDYEITHNYLNPEKPYFPYSKKNPDYHWLWSYYKFDEYPVSMLIPPNNTFLNSFVKQTLLFVHGWEGDYTYSTNPDAIPTANEVSYWYSTVYYVNGNNHFNPAITNFDGWQIYYPHNTDHVHIAKCLKFDINYLKLKYSNSPYKLGLIAHSMGGLVINQYLTDSTADSCYQSYIKSTISKVLYFTSPLHGSSGGNNYYKSSFDPILGYDSHAPAVRDLGIGSDEITKINSRQLVDLNGNGELRDDYFVILGSTPRYYKSDRKYIEAKNHYDGIVSISSASFLDKMIGFAVMHGNHDDGRHAQSKSKVKNNIGKGSFLPSIINHFFSDASYFAFKRSLINMTDIKAVVNEEAKVEKPLGQTALNELETNNGVDYKKELFSFRLGKNSSNSPYSYNSYYNPTSGKILLIPNGTVNAPSNVLSKLINGMSYLGAFNKTKISDNNTYFLWNATDGSTINLPEGCYNINLYDNQLRQKLPTKSINLKYCKSLFLDYTSGTSKSSEEYNNSTDSKWKHLLNASMPGNDSLYTSFSIDDRATKINFELSCFETSIEPLSIFLKRPDGQVIDSSSSSPLITYDTTTSTYSITIEDPMPGRWYVWARSVVPGADTIQFQAYTSLASSVYAHYLSDSILYYSGQSYQINALLDVDSISLCDSLSVNAIVFRSEGTATDTLNLYQHTLTPTNLIFQNEFTLDSSGIYQLKISYDGIYNGYRFERVIFHELEVVDTTVTLHLPDIMLQQNSSDFELDLRRYAFNYTCTYDSLRFTTEVISNNIDTSAFNIYINDSTQIAYYSTNLSDTGTIVIKYDLHLPNNRLVHDTIVVRIELTDFNLLIHSVTPNSVLVDSSMIIDLSLFNSGNASATKSTISYFLSSDMVLDSSDLQLSSRIVEYLEPCSNIFCQDSLKIPFETMQGPYYIIVKADVLDEQKEIDENNNLLVIPLLVRRLPSLNIKLFLEGLMNHQTGQMNYAQSENGQKFTNYVDQIKICIASQTAPFAIVKTFEHVGLDVNGICSITLPEQYQGSYFIIINHRNSIETWSSSPIAINPFITSYDFTDDINKAYGNNLKLINGKYCIYGGDVNQDGIVDGSDMSQVDNAATGILIGYYSADSNGDGIVDASDMSLIDNNSTSLIKVKKP